MTKSLALFQLEKTYQMWQSLYWEYEKMRDAVIKVNERIFNLDCDVLVMKPFCENCRNKYFTHIDLIEITFKKYSQNSY